MVIWAIGSDDEGEDLRAFAEQMGLTFPVLYDRTGDVHAEYTVQAAFDGTSFPQDWVIGADGRVVFVSNSYDPEALRRVLDDALGR